MYKLVNIVSKVAIRTVTPKICGIHKNVLMSTGDILRCICMRAHVEEILPDGSVIVLNSTNYNKDNNTTAGIIVDNAEIETKSDETTFDSVFDTDNENMVDINEITEIVDDSIKEVEEDVGTTECDQICCNAELSVEVPHTNSTNRNNGKKNKKKR